MDKQAENESKDNKVRHSGFGIASFVIGILSLVYYWFLFIGNIISADMMMGDGVIVLLIMYSFPGLLSNLLGIFLAILGLGKGDKIFSILGVVSNSLLIIYKILLLNGF